MGSPISPMMASAMGRTSSGSVGATPGSQAASSSRVLSVAWPRFSPQMRMESASGHRRVPPHSGQASSLRNLATRLRPFSSLTLESAFSTVRTAL